VNDHTKSSPVAILLPYTGYPCQIDEIRNIINLQINLNDVIHLDKEIMGHQIRDSFCDHKDLSHFAQLVLHLLRCNAMNNKVNFEALGDSSLNFATNLNQSLHADLLYFIFCQGILKSFPEKNDERKTFFFCRNLWMDKEEIYKFI
jgi:hypothetical protein